MARRTRRHHGRRRSRRRREAPSVSIAGYTRYIDLAGTVSTANQTQLVTADVPDVVTPADETVNRKIVGISGQAMFSAALAAGHDVAAQFCLWAHPSHEEWPTVDKYDPFNDGPGEDGFEGMLAPRTFCRRTMVMTVATSGSTQTIQQDHMIRSRAERLLRPGWKLTAGLYLRGNNTSISVAHLSLLRYVVAG